MGKTKSSELPAISSRQVPVVPIKLVPESLSHLAADLDPTLIKELQETPKGVPFACSSAVRLEEKGYGRSKPADSRQHPQAFPTQGKYAVARIAAEYLDQHLRRLSADTSIATIRIPQDVALSSVGRCNCWIMPADSAM